MNDLKMLSIRQCAKLGYVSENTLRLMVKQRKVPVVYVGKKALINVHLLENVLSNGEVMHIDTKH